MLLKHYMLIYGGYNDSHEWIDGFCLVDLRDGRLRPFLIPSGHRMRLDFPDRLVAATAVLPREDESGGHLAWEGIYYYGRCGLMHLKLFKRIPVIEHVAPYWGTPPHSMLFLPSFRALLISQLGAGLVVYYLETGLQESYDITVGSMGLDPDSGGVLCYGGYDRDRGMLGRLSELLIF